VTRTERLLRLARLRGDRLAIATLEGKPKPRRLSPGKESEDFLTELYARNRVASESEVELRTAWGDR